MPFECSLAAMTCAGSPATSASRSQRHRRFGGTRTGGAGITQSASALPRRRSHCSSTSPRPAGVRGPCVCCPGLIAPVRRCTQVFPEAHADDADLPAQHPALADQPNQVTLSLRSGDAVLLDYRLLHGTHPNMATERRDAVLLSFAPSWRELPKDVQAHLIQHPALPTQDEDVPPTAGCAQLLPRFFGARADLAINRNPPVTFTVSH